MRIGWLLLALVTLTGSAAAESARVISGEHANFTRLVIELPSALDWTVGRTAMGYGFVADATSQPAYDLSKVWDRIPRSRVQAMRVDPGSGALLLTLACDCHVFPFEYQPGTVVLDIRNGPAPPGSAFEVALSPVKDAAMADRSPLRRTAAGYDWLGQPRRVAGMVRTGHFPLPLARTGSLAMLRDELLMQLSRGAVSGVVQMALPGKPVMPEVEGMGDLSGALIRIGELPGIQVGSASDPDGRADKTCIADSEIDLASWGAGRPPLDLLVKAREGLYGEFDTPAPAPLLQAVRLHLYLGFGAEARQYGALLAATGDAAALGPLMSMARLVDGAPDPTSPFAPMLGCGGLAALWAALAQSSLPATGNLDADAVVRSFQSLPPHLRRHLGPRLATLLLDRDNEAARMIRDAIERTPDIPAGTVALLSAEADLQASRPEDAISHAEAAVRENAAGLAELVALVEAHFQSGTPLSPEVSESLRAMRDVSGPDLPRRDRALILALALSGQPDDAFDLAGSGNPAAANLWEALLRQPDDDAFLRHAVLSAAASPPQASADVAKGIAARLADLGFPEAALVWLGSAAPDSAPERRILAAGAELALGNARGSLQLLSGLSGPAALDLQVAAYRQLGLYDAASQLLADAGQAEDSARLAAWNDDWAVLQTGGSPVWAAAAALVGGPPAVVAGPLAEGKAALDDSAAARTAIATLLAEVPSPVP